MNAIRVKQKNFQWVINTIPTIYLEFKFKASEREKNFEEDDADDDDDDDVTTTT